MLKTQPFERLKFDKEPQQELTEKTEIFFSVFSVHSCSKKSVSFGGKAFPPKYAEVTESRRKKLWQNDLPAESFQIILP
jgi:hypothetical protein